MRVIKSFFREIYWAVVDLRQDYWTGGFQWRPKFSIGRLYYDGWWYYLHLGFFWVGTSPYPLLYRPEKKD